MRRLLRRAMPAPALPLYAIGDIHGRADLLDAVLELIAADRAAHGIADARLIFLGDYVDRGPDSAGVLQRLRKMQDAAPRDVVCLMGNHERMMLDALDDPTGRGERWLGDFGGPTLRSYGIDGGVEDMRAAERLRAALPTGLEDWLRALPLWHRSGDVVCVHAGMDPALPPEAQTEATMLWMRPGRFARSRRDGLWIVHGHTVVPVPSVARRTICVDTGASASGRLTAAAILPDAPVRFLQTTG